MTNAHSIDTSVSKQDAKTKTFISKAKKKHGNRYDYSKVVYLSCREKVVIICRNHGDFNQNPSQHLTTSGCQTCANQKTTANRRMSKVDFIKRSIIKHGEKYSYDDVVIENHYSKVVISCDIHGDFKQQVGVHLRGNGCPKCGKIKASQKISDTKIDFIAKAKVVHGNKYDYSNLDYKGSTRHVTITCLTHGDFSQYAANHIAGNGCPKCANAIKASKKTISFDDVVSRAKVRHGERYRYIRSSFVGAKQNMDIVCKIHGLFEMNVNRHLTGANCQKCAREGSGHHLANFKTACDRNNNGNGILYIIQCRGNDEVFYKIGITSRSIAERFQNKSLIPYDIKEVFVLDESSTFIFKLEKRLHRLLASSNYKPALRFAGYTECFEGIKPIEKLMKELVSTDQLQLLA